VSLPSSLPVPTNAVSSPPDGRSVTHASNHPPTGHTSLNEKGWVVGPEGLLFWVPEDCRYGLTHMPMMTIRNIGRERAVRIDFRDFRYGNLWAEIYKKRTDVENSNAV
jgi:hypothetical protein